jgi:hypothetical protein
MLINNMNALNFTNTKDTKNPGSFTPQTPDHSLLNFFAGFSNAVRIPW